MNAEVGTQQAGASTADWWLVIALTAASALVLFDVTAFGVALPSLRADLGLGPAAAGWVVNAYIVAVTALTALGGRLADRLDRVRVFQAGAALFALAAWRSIFSASCSSESACAFWCSSDSSVSSGARPGVPATSSRRFLASVCALSPHARQNSK